MQGAVLGAAAKFPSKYMTAAMAGQSVGGIFPVVVDIIVTSIDIPQRDVGLACFIIATLVLAVNLAIFYFSSKTAFFRFHIRDQVLTDGEEESSVAEEEGSLIARVAGASRRSWHYCVAIFVSFAVSLSVFPALTVNVESQFKHHTLLAGKSGKWADTYFQLVGNFLLFNIGKTKFLLLTRDQNLLGLKVVYGCIKENTFFQAICAAGP